MKTAADRMVCDRGHGDGDALGDHLSGLGKRRKGARDECCQGKHEAAEPDEHWRGSFLDRVGDDEA